MTQTEKCSRCGSERIENDVWLGPEAPRCLDCGLTQHDTGTAEGKEP
jgi:hypothetical protein